MSRFALALIAALIAAPAGAGNGKVGAVFPVPGIVVDGDLSDWPAQVPVYTVAHHGAGEELSGPADLTASMRVALSPDRRYLFVAVETVDESIVIDDDPDPLWNQNDGCEVYVGLERMAYGEALTQEALYGSSQQHRGDEDSLSVVAAASTAHGRVYEWRVDLQRLSGSRFEDSLRGFSFDVAVCDRDADGSFSWVAWGPGTLKVGSIERMGVLLVLEPGAGIEEIVDAAVGQQRASDAGRHRSVSYQMFLVGVLLTVTLLHLLLVLFGSQRFANSSYALFTGSAAAVLYLVAGRTGAWDGDLEETSTSVTASLPGVPSAAESVLAGSAIVVIGLFGLLFLYAVFRGRVQPVFWFLVGAVVLAEAYLVYMLRDPANEELVVTIAGGMFGVVLMAWMIADAGRLLVTAVLRRQDGALLIGVGAAAFIGFSIYGQFANQLSPVLMLGILLPVLAVSVHLARSVARTRRELHQQLLETREAQQRLEESNRALAAANEAVHEATRNKSEFLRRMSHDLRSPMNAIIGYTRLVLRRAADRLDEREQRNLRNIQTSSNNLLNLINDILDLSRIEAGRVELHVQSTDLRLLVEQCASSLESLVKPGVELRRELAAAASLDTDPDRLRQVVMNLLGNAVKFTDAGHITLSLTQMDGVTEILVADTGIGIPAEDLPHIFDEFRQVERQGGEQTEGTGLGLSIARKTVELLGGRLTAASQVGAGTTFTVRFDGPEP